MPRKLLLADDSVTIQRVIELTFADEDIRVTSVGDGDAAIRLLETDPPDIVLADVGMPGRDGYAVARHVHDSPALKGIPVLLLTGAFDPVDEDRLRALGCAGVLVKPFEPQMLIARVRELLDKAPGRPVPAVGGTEVPPFSGAGEGAGSPGGPGSGSPGGRDSNTTPAIPVSPGGRDCSPAVTAAGDVPAAGDEPRSSSSRAEALSPPDALIAAPSSPAADQQSSSVDEYFARLDAAFATLDVPLDMPRSSDQRSARRPVRADEAGETPVPAAAPVTPAAAEAAPPPPATLADAFSVLLGVEQGEPAPVFADAWQPPVTDDLVDAVARRVAERMTEQVVRDLAPDIVSRVAERMVREEIERLKSIRS